jgi:hypothetical protein
MKLGYRRRQAPSILFGQNAIARKLNERNVKAPRGGVWTNVQVGAIL